MQAFKKLKKRDLLNKEMEATEFNVHKVQIEFGGQE